jgi:hypothetical protein
LTCRDIKLVVGEEEIGAHKTVLCCRSPVFAAMLLRSGMSESKSGEIRIDDMDAQAMREFIRSASSALFPGLPS